MSAVERPSLAQLAVALAAGIAMFTYAGALADPAAAAETHYLAVWGTLMLVALAGLAVPPAYDLAAAAVLATMVVWVVPHGPTRSAALGLLLTLALAVLSLRHLERSRGEPSWSWAIPAALGVQFLLRSERLLFLGLEPSILVGVVILPVGAAVAVMAYHGREGSRAALVAAATAALLAPGWSVTVTLSLLAVAVALLWRDGVGPRWLVAVLAVAVLAAAAWWQLPLLWLLLLTLLGEAGRASWKTLAVILLATLLILVFVPAARPWSSVIHLLSLAPLLLPAVLVPADSRRLKVAQGWLLAVLALRVVPGPGALAAPLVIVALSLRSQPALTALQSLWSGVLLAGTALLAAYPWLRAEPLDDLLGLFGLSVGWPSAVAVASAFWLLVLLSNTLGRSSLGVGRRPVIVGGLLLAVVVWAHLPPAAELPLGERVRVLNEAEPSLSADVEGDALVRSVVIDTYLDNAAALPIGKAVARVRLLCSDGEPQVWLLKAGLDTGEWAARRPDVARLPGFEAPPHWLAWVAPTGELFAQRYRGWWEPDEACRVTRVEVQRFEDLPPPISMAVLHLELRR